MTLPRAGHPTTVRLPEALKRFLQRRARTERRHFGHLVVKILEDWAIERGYPPPAGDPPETKDKPEQ